MAGKLLLNLVFQDWRTATKPCVFRAEKLQLNLMDLGWKYANKPRVSVL